MAGLKEKGAKFSAPLEAEVKGSFESRSSRSAEAIQQDPNLKQHSKIKLESRACNPRAWVQARDQEFKAILVCPSTWTI